MFSHGNVLRDSVSVRHYQMYENPIVFYFTQNTWEIQFASRDFLFHSALSRKHRSGFSCLSWPKPGHWSSIHSSLSDSVAQTHIHENGAVYLLGKWKPLCACDLLDIEMMQRTANENAACLRRICKRSDQPKIERLVNNNARLIISTVQYFWGRRSFQIRYAAHF